MKPYEHQIEKECYCCEVDFLILSDANDVTFCPFCGEELEPDYDEADEDQSDRDEE